MLNVVDSFRHSVSLDHRPVNARREDLADSHPSTTKLAGPRRRQLP
jgi:hypothetical protein